MSKAILIIGATGKQGGAVLRALVDHPNFTQSSHSFYAVTRNPDSASAQKLASRSSAIKLIQGDLADIPGIFSKLPTKPWGVYAMTNPGKNETEQGVAIVNEAVKAGSSHFVFSSVDRGSENGGFVPTDVPHFITKHKIEEKLREVAAASKGAFTYTVLRPAFFLDNLEWGSVGKVISVLWRDHVPKDEKLAVIDTKDIGNFGAEAFMSPESGEYKNQSINLAGDELTFQEANEIFKKKTGQPIPTSFGFLATLLLLVSKDMRMMTEFWKTAGFGAKPEEGRKLHKMKDFAAWVDSSSFTAKP